MTCAPLTLNTHKIDLSGGVYVLAFLKVRYADVRYMLGVPESGELKQQYILPKEPSLQLACLLSYVYQRSLEAQRHA
jgi:hypothetical protein